ncbi:MAG TPA: heat-shock protein, partial [Wenzhouxiangella sp.]|nr:heat-shock protein [Wenzhouxiangella sp.]
MTTFDLSPLYRTAIGFDRMADMLTNAQRVDTNGYPPYNIESLGEDRYRITMAVAG